MSSDVSDEVDGSVDEQSEGIDVVEVDEVEFDVVELDDDDADDDADDAADDDAEDVLLLEEVDQELVLAVWEPTGEPRVDTALDLLASLDPDDVHTHAAVFDDIHQQLRATLTDLDTTSS